MWEVLYCIFVEEAVIQERYVSKDETYSNYKGIDMRLLYNGLKNQNSILFSF